MKSGRGNITFLFLPVIILPPTALQVWFCQAYMSLLVCVALAFTLCRTVGERNTQYLNCICCLFKFSYILTFHSASQFFNEDYMWGYLQLWYRWMFEIAFSCTERSGLVLDFIWCSCCNVHIFRDVYFVIGTLSLNFLLFNTGAAFS